MAVDFDDGEPHMDQLCKYTRLDFEKHDRIYGDCSFCLEKLEYCCNEWNQPWHYGYINYELKLAGVDRNYQFG